MDIEQGPTIIPIMAYLLRLFVPSARTTNYGFKTIKSNWT